jgi:hypothetical protein
MPNGSASQPHDNGFALVSGSRQTPTHRGGTLFFSPLVGESQIADAFHLMRLDVARRIQADLGDRVGVGRDRCEPPTRAAGEAPERSTRRTRRTPLFTSSPDQPAPEIRCPTCDVVLVYQRTVIGGVRPVERWDYLSCRTCGEFVYRDRTRRLRPAT